MSEDNQSPHDKTESVIPETPSQADPPKAFFKMEKMDDPQVVRKFMLEAGERMAEAVIWLSGEKECIKTRIPQEIGRDQVVHFAPPREMHPLFEPETLKKTLEERQISDLMIRLYLPGAAILGVKARFLDADEHGYRFEMPKAAVYMQRRKHRRFTIPLAYEMNVDAPHPKSPKLTVSRRLIDVSVEGVSFLVTKSEGDFYKPGRMLPNLVLTIRGRKIKVSAEVKNLRPFMNSKLSGMQVGAKIIQIEDADADYLTAYVEEMLIQYSRHDHTAERVTKDKK